MSILVINGANLNMLGIREPHVYGKATFAELESYINSCADEVGLQIQLFQSNHEGAIVDRIQAAYTDGTQGIIINAGAYTHTSLAILDALQAVAIPTVEVHLTRPDLREEYRHFSFIAQYAEQCFSGEGFASYKRAIQYFADKRL